MRYLTIATALGWSVLMVPEWPIYRTYWQNLAVLAGYFLALGPLLILLVLFLNKLVNISFDIHYGKDKHDK